MSQQLTLTHATDVGRDLMESGNSLFVVGDSEFSQEDADDFLEENYPAIFNQVDFVEFDKSVANFFNFKKAAIYHVK